MTQPTYTELVELVVNMRVELDALRAENSGLKERVMELEAQVRANSRNSSKPPSSDGPAKPTPRSLRGKSKRRPGGQPGHPGATLEQVADPDVVIRHEPTSCRGCGSDVSGAEQVDCSRRQVFDIPPISVHVTEHQVITRRCACGTRTTGAAPKQAAAPVQYGPVMCAVIVYLFMGQFLSKKRTAQVLSELFGVPVSDGTVAAVTARAAGDLGEFTAQVTARLNQSPVVHFDETGLRCEGRNAWLHTASTPTMSLLFAHRRRGVEAMNAMGVLPGFTGTAVHRTPDIDRGVDRLYAV
jgi:transposase